MPLSYRVVTLFRTVFPLAPHSCVARLVSFTLIVWFLLLAAPLGARTAETDDALSSIRILYTADTLGFLHPCATCGKFSYGGLARRAALLSRLAAAGSRTLVLAGPNEFYSDREDACAATAQQVTPILHAAFSRMPYTAVYLSPPTVRQMQQDGLPLPENAVPVASTPVIKYYRVGDVRVGCVFLPAASGAGGRPGYEQVQEARRLAGEAAATADLVVAVSPWGIRAENSLAASFAGVVHILLGGGEGIAVPGQATGDDTVPGPLWIRADRRGRAVSVLDIHALPARGTPWREGIHFSACLAFLDAALPEDAYIRARIGERHDSE